MNEKSDSENHKNELVYLLDVRIPDQFPKRMEVFDQVLAGLDPRNDLILVDPKVLPKHFLFSHKNNILTVHCFGNDSESFLNGLPLENNKNYILEKADVLKVGKVQITIHKVAWSGKIKHPEKTNPHFHLPSVDELKNLNDVKDEIAPAVSHKKPTHHELSLSNFNAIKFIPYKVYGFSVDIALTYFVLSFIIPRLGLLSATQSFFYPISKYGAQFMILHQSFIHPMKILSLIEFFICFHILMISGSLILGTTPGAFLIGFHHKDNNKSILALRFKAYIYALLNVFVLPLLIFDIPLYKGRTLKELITFSERELTSSSFFTILRRAITPVLTIACFFSPFFLTLPFTANITKETTFIPKYKDIHATNFSSSSRSLGISLNSNLSPQFGLLPYFENNKIGLILYDMKNKKSLLMQEQNRTSLSYALFKLRYANPFASLTIPDNLIENETLKTKSILSLNLSLTNLVPGILEYGPFMANGFLFKNLFLDKFKARDNFLLNSFDQKNPAISISASEREVKVFLFARQEIIEFSLSGPKQSKLLENFTSGILDGLRFDQSNDDGIKAPQILEVLDAFERSNYPILLTYYINEAKKIHDLADPSWRAFFLKNVLQTKQALMEDKTRVGMNKNIEKSFDDILKTF